MSTIAWLFWGLVFSSIGMGYFMYGKKRARMVTLACGVALMLYPYLVSNGWAMVGIGLALVAIPYFVRQ